MSLEEAKKRKACQSCTKAKAKCSPFEDRPDICYRCQRLKRKCVFDDTVRKRGTKNRSRVKQLGQRVDTLIDLLANGQASTVRLTAATNTNHSISTANAAPHGIPPESATHSEGCYRNSEPCATPVQNPEIPFPHEEPYPTYDPVEAGLLDDGAAEFLLQEYRDSCASAFPFVIIPQPVDAKALRQSQPFLFHAILTATNHRNASLQLTLAAELKEQIASRVIKHSHKSLELLQGLLLFTAWYHFYYDPVKQQLATLLQLCVAMVQDLGFSKNPQNAKKTLAIGESGGAQYSVRTLAEKRAFLGTFYLTASFSQAWRKRATLSHTRYMDQCCQHLAANQEYASDALITPLIQLSALMCRVNDYFSYDDIENAEVKGEALVQLSATNFESELARLVESVPPALIGNSPTLRLTVCLLGIWIHECGVHSSLWSPSGGLSAISISATRLKALCRCLNAVQSYMNTLIAVPQTSIHHLAFPLWSAWYYATIIACKLVFLEDERGQQTEVTETFAEVTRLVMDKSLSAEPRPCSLPVEAMPSSWNPIAVAKEAEVLSLFHQMYSKMKFTLPEDLQAWKGDRCKIDPLSKIAFFQRNLLVSFTNRLNEHMAKVAGTDKTTKATKERSAVVQQESWVTQQTEYARERLERLRMPLLQNLHFQTMNFDSIAPPEDFVSQDGTFSDWLWNTAMDDFTMLPL